MKSNLGLFSLDFLIDADSTNLTSLEVKGQKKFELNPFMWNSISASNIKDTIWEKLNDQKI